MAPIYRRLMIVIVMVFVPLIVWGYFHPVLSHKPMTRGESAKVAERAHASMEV